MFYTSVLNRFKWDYLSESRSIDLLLAVGGNDLIKYGLTGLSHGLREWSTEIEHYSVSRGVSATIALCTLPWYVYYCVHLSLTTYFSAPRLESLSSNLLARGNHLIR